MKISSTCALAIVFSVLLGGAANAADYTVTVEPNYPPAQAQEVYKPLLAYLSKATGHRFILKTSGNYHVFWRDMRGPRGRVKYSRSERPRLRVVTTA